MLLAIDIGNTNIHMGLWQDNVWRWSWRMRTVQDKMPDEYAVLVRNLLNTVSIDYHAISGVVIGSVVPPLTLAFAELSERYLNKQAIVISHTINTGIKVAIDQPQQAGADRIVNSAAVFALYDTPAIVVDFGTATTFDVVSAQGEYLGGAIAPGITLAHDALVSRAARLHKIDLQPPPDAIGKNTIHALQSGIFWGYVGLVEGLVTRLKASMPDEHIHVFGTGGLATLFKQHTTIIDRIIPELTLDGMRVIYELNNGMR